MKKWEYRSYTINVKTLAVFDEEGSSKLVSDANKLGEEGWELININAESNDFWLAVAIFKREVLPSYKSERVYLFADNKKVGEEHGYLRFGGDWRGAAVQFARTLDCEVKVLDVGGENVETITKDSVPF